MSGQDPGRSHEPAPPGLVVDEQDNRDDWDVTIVFAVLDVLDVSDDLDVFWYFHHILCFVGFAVLLFLLF